MKPSLVDLLGVLEQNRTWLATALDRHKRMKAINCPAMIIERNMKLIVRRQSRIERLKRLLTERN